MTLTAERDAAIDRLLSARPFPGWQLSALVEVVGPDADLLFPGGQSDLIEAYCDLADRRMEAGATEFDMSALRLPARVRTVIALRLTQNRPHKDAVRRAVGVLARPRNAGLSVRCTARTVDAIWHAAGDVSVDFSWYTKRAILAGIYGVTLLYWLRDDSDGDAATLAFLDRRLADVGRISRLRRRAGPAAQRPASGVASG